MLNKSQNKAKTYVTKILAVRTLDFHKDCGYFTEERHRHSLEATLLRLEMFYVRTNKMSHVSDLNLMDSVCRITEFV